MNCSPAAHIKINRSSARSGVASRPVSGGPLGRPPGRKQELQAELIALGPTDRRPTATGRCRATRTPTAEHRHGAMMGKSVEPRIEVSEVSTRAPCAMGW